MTKPVIGEPIKRSEDLRRLTGKGLYTDDVGEPSACRAAMVRSPHPHAKIVSIDVSAATAIPGVLCALTHQDWIEDGLNNIPHSPIPSGGDGLGMTEEKWQKIFVGHQYPLAVDRVRHVGEVVVIVVGETEAAATEGAEAVRIEYDPLPAITDTRMAADPESPRLWDETENTCLDTSFGDKAATDAAFANAAHIVKHEFRIARVTGVPMEPRAATGEYDAETDSYTLTAGGGGAVRFKKELIRIFDLPPENIRVITLEVGGNFGTRNRLYPEFPLVMWAAKRVGAPVRWLSDRGENFQSDYQGRDLVTALELALDKDGRFLALRADNISNIGAFTLSFTPLSKGAEIATGPYAFPCARVRARGVFSSTPPTNPYRSAGRPEVIYVLERLVDIAANQIGMDRVEIRRKNLIPDDAFPFDNPLGMTYDCGEMLDCLNEALEAADWDGYEARKADSGARGMLRGRGIACYVESSSGAPLERSEIAIRPGSGTVEVVIGTQDSGQGHETSFCQVAAEWLSVPFERVRLLQGDTDFVSVGGGSHSGRSMRMAGTVIVMAADRLIEKGKKLAAHVFEAALEDVEYEDGIFSVGGTDRKIGWFELADAIDVRDDIPEELAGGLSEAAENLMRTPAFPSGTHVCEVEIDPETGVSKLLRYAAIDDVGRVINPVIVDGQIHGGIVQGLGESMVEDFVFDPETGQPLAASLMDYGLPRAEDVPFFVTGTHEVLTKLNPLGIKSGGEAGTTPALGAYMNAVADALGPLGVVDVEMPATPHRIWQSIREAKSR